MLEVEMQPVEIEVTIAASDVGDLAPAAESGDPAPLPRGCIGRVAAPPLREATSEDFYFWVPQDVLVERTQLVTCTSTIAGAAYRFIVPTHVGVNRPPRVP